MGRSDIQLDDFLAVRTVTDIAVSPDGEAIAFAVLEADGDENAWWKSLFVAPADGSVPPRRLTRTASVSSPKWSPDGSTVSFIARRDPDAAVRIGDAALGDAASKPQVWAFDVDRPGDPRQLTALDGGVGEYDWSPDGERLVVATRESSGGSSQYSPVTENAPDPIVTERVQYKFLNRWFAGDARTVLSVVDVDSMAETRLEDAYGRGVFEAITGLQPIWSPDGDRIAFTSNFTDDPDTYVMDVHTITPDGSDRRTITDGEHTAFDLAWSPDGERLGFVARDWINWYRPREAFVAPTDGDGYRSISGPLDRTVHRIAWLDESTLLGPIADEGRTRLARFYADGRDPERVFDRLGETETVYNWRFDLDGDTIGICLAEPDTGPDVYALDARGVDDPDAVPTKITDVNGAWLDDRESPDCERTTFTNGDGGEIEGFVYYPPGFDADREEPCPLVLSLDPGPAEYDTPEFRYDFLHWTSRGYVVVQLNYRGCGSYGRAFAEEARGDWGPKQVDDVVSALSELRERGWFDPDRVFAVGFSFGAILAGWLLTRTDVLTAAAVERGPYDFRSAFGASDFHHWYEFNFGLPWENPETYREISPVARAGELSEPVLISAGGRDYRAPVSQAEQLYVAAKKAGAPAKLVVYPEAPHAPHRLDPESAHHRLVEITDWFERHDPGFDS